ncbi:squamosa promoter-binding-like protein 1 [Cryptomeria japonica]|uniref:squamosa promoter-binding-like protein 1 n=1 Tax=Cryptomeria japonica TaxID=3369 RepID=UPI0027DA7B02|nr:squamosa promoter-binding-like protein 1 [Cryptomeria japonica]
MDGHTGFQSVSLGKLPKENSGSFLHLLIPGQESDLPIAKKSFGDSANVVLGQSSLQPNCYSEEYAKGHWDSNSWNWDGVSFLAKPKGKCLTTNEPEQLHDSETIITVDGVSDHSDVSIGVLKLGTDEFQRVKDSSSKLKRKQSFDASRQVLDTTKPYFRDSSSGGNSESLTLNLGGMPYSCTDDGGNRRTKCNRPDSPGKGYPMCQVDNCQINLTDAKDYHRRHKVCEMHFKANKALVNRLMQRFCQQCSRFHPIEHFDDEKRSCRRRLAGHNRRRRRTRYEDGACKQLVQEGTDQTLNKLDIVRLIGILSKIQGDRLVDQSNLDCNYILQCLKTANIVSQNGQISDKDLNNAHLQPDMDAIMRSLQTIVHQSSQMNASLLPFISAFAGCSSDALALLLRIVSRDCSFPMVHASPELPTNQNLQTINQNYKSGIVSEKSNSTILKGTVELHPSVNGHSPDVSKFSGQISSSSDGDNQYFTKKICDVVEERYQSTGPSSILQLSPPVLQNLLPSSENTRDSKSSAHKMEHKHPSSNENVSKSTLIGSVFKNNTPSYLSGTPNIGKPLPKIGSNCLYGSNEALCSSFQNHTDRIVFKLFDKDPGDFPLTLRTQIIEWLSQIPSDMESYIRPGCVILSIYVAMPSCAWEQLGNSLQETLERLVASHESDFWRTDKILVQVKQRLASVKDGKIRLSKTLMPRNAPEIYSVWPIAIVAGEDTTLVLRGRNLNVPGTKFLCAYKGKYTFAEVPERVEESNIYPRMIHEQTRQLLRLSGGPANVLGRCFIEVEHILKGNTFPIIVADSAICMELHSLQLEICDSTTALGSTDVDSFDDHVLDNVQLGVKMETLFFLNELGWLFQRSNWETKYIGKSPATKFSVSRFRSLLIYAVEHDWRALMKRLLDLFFIMNVGQEGLSQEAIENLSEANLLHRSVKRKCRQMVDLLLHYSPPSNHTHDFKNSFTFTPDMAGPLGLTPLHIAANMQNAEDMVDALTSDPHEVGLYTWSSTLDTSQKSPETYAMLQGNISYMHMIQIKLSIKRSPQVMIRICEAKASLDEPKTPGGTSAVARGTELARPQLQQSNPPRSETCGRLVRATTTLHGSLCRPFHFSRLYIAAVFVCVCLIFKGPPQVASVSHFKWENVDFGLF